MKVLHRQLKDRSVRARQGCFSLLSELADVLPGCLAEYMPVLVAGKRHLIRPPALSLFTNIWGSPFP